MITNDDITRYTRTMKEYYISSYQNDVRLLKTFFSAPKVGKPKEILLAMELSELKSLVYETNKELRNLANLRLQSMRRTAYAGRERRTKQGSF